MKCHKTYRFFEYLEGKLSLEEITAIDKHLENCPICNETFQIVKQSLQLIETQKNIPENPYLISRIEGKIAMKELARSQVYRRILQPVFILGILAVSITGGIMVSGTLGKSTPISKNVNQEYQYYVSQEPIETTLLATNN